MNGTVCFGKLSGIKGVGEMDRGARMRKRIQLGVTAVTREGDTASAMAAGERGSARDMFGGRLAHSKRDGMGQESGGVRVS